MSAPTTTFTEDLYTFQWPDLGIEAVVDRLIEEKTDIRCELTVNSSHPTYGGRLYSGHLLLMGPNSRRDVRGQLLERFPELDWGGILEQLCLLARERYRRGEPVVDLLDVDPAQKSRFIYEPFILENGITILYGDGAAAKSNLALRWGVEVSLQRGAVLYLDWEDDAATHAERLRALMKGIGIEAPGYGVFYQRRSARIADSVREIRRVIAEKGISLVIVDSLGMAAGDPNNSDLVIEAMRSCRALGVAVLAIHHLPKNAIDKSKPFGTVYASNEARLTWLVEKTQEEEADEFTVLLTNHKSNRSRVFGKRAMRIVFENKDEELVSLRIGEVQPETVEAFRAKIALWKHISSVLKKPLPITAIRDLLKDEGREVSLASIRRAINENKRVFINIGSEQAAVWGVRSPIERTERTNAYEGVYA